MPLSRASLAGSRRVWAPALPPYPPYECRLPAGCTEFTIGYNKTAHPWKWTYDADAEHARYLQRHPEKASVTQAA